MDSPDDAGVYRLNDDTALIQTVDFITPIVDDPFTFGQIAAANSISDVYAMGGTPVTAMDIACFPKKGLDVSVLREIILGALDRINEAGAVLIGGHTVQDPELKFGLSVTGVIHPRKVLTKGGMVAGDRLVLTKAIGTGIISTAAKGGAVVDDAMAAAVKSMVTLNAVASRLAQQTGVHACTDITGFGLLGHAAEMVEQSRVGLQIEWEAVPLLPRVQDLADAGFVPGGTARNREFRASQVRFSVGLPPSAGDVLFDPQTSGGLLLAVAQDKADGLLQDLRQAGIEAASIIGAVLAEPKNVIIVT